MKIRLTMKNMIKRIWNILKDLIVKNIKDMPFYIETRGQFLSKPNDIANHFNEYFLIKLNNLKKINMPRTDTQVLYLIKKKILKGKRNFNLVNISTTDNMLKRCKTNLCVLTGLT